MLNENVRWNLSAQSSSVTLTERRQAPQSDMEVTVADLAPTTTVIALNETSHLSILAQRPSVDWNKICDYLLVDDRDSTCHATLVELKTTLEDMGKALEQLRRSLPLVEYLLSACSIEAEADWEPTVTYALIAEKRTNRIDKQPTRPQVGRLQTQRHRQIEVDVFVGTTVRAKHLGLS